MSISEIPYEEGELLNVISRVAPLEWRKYTPRYPSIRISGRMQTVDQSGFPPRLVFRFESDAKEVIDLLKQAIEEYKGDVGWGIFEHKRIGLPGVNWLIAPKRLMEVDDLARREKLSASEYIAKYEPEFGPAAYADMRALTAHVKKFLDKRNRA